MAFAGSDDGESPPKLRRYFAGTKPSPASPHVAVDISGEAPSGRDSAVVDRAPIEGFQVREHPGGVAINERARRVEAEAAAIIVGPSQQSFPRFAPYLVQ